MHRHTSRMIWFSPACEVQKRITHCTSTCYQQQATPRYPSLKSMKRGASMTVFQFVLNDSLTGSEWEAKRYWMTASLVLYGRACCSGQWRLWNSDNETLSKIYPASRFRASFHRAERLWQSRESYHWLLLPVERQWASPSEKSIWWLVTSWLWQTCLFVRMGVVHQYDK